MPYGVDFIEFRDVSFFDIGRKKAHGIVEIILDDTIEEQGVSHRICIKTRVPYESGETILQLQDKLLAKSIETMRKAVELCEGKSAAELLAMSAEKVRKESLEYDGGGDA